MIEFSHEEYLCEDCHYPVDGYGLCILYEAWRDTGMDMCGADNPCERVKKMREQLIKNGVLTEQYFVDSGNVLIADLKAMEG